MASNNEMGITSAERWKGKGKGKRGVRGGGGEAESVALWMLTDRDQQPGS